MTSPRWKWLLQKCQWFASMLAMYNGQYHAENYIRLMTLSNYEKSWSGTTRTINFGPSILDPIYVIYAFGSMLSCILCERQKFSESHKLKRFGARNQFRAARFVTVSFIRCSLNAMELVVRNLSVGCPGTTKSWDRTLDWWLLTSSEMSDMHASHV